MPDRNNRMAKKVVISAERAAYESTVEFRAYLKAFLIAERLQRKWRADGTAERRIAWIDASMRADALLKKCRALPEHRAAFGW
jgi:hypothetical protein